MMRQYRVFASSCSMLKGGVDDRYNELWNEISGIKKNNSCQTKPTKKNGEQMKWNITLSKQSCHFILQWNKLVDDLLCRDAFNVYAHDRLLCFNTIFIIMSHITSFLLLLHLQTRPSCHRALNYTVIQVHFISFHFISIFLWKTTHWLCSSHRSLM